MKYIPRVIAVYFSLSANLFAGQFGTEITCSFLSSRSNVTGGGTVSLYHDPEGPHSLAFRLHSDGFDYLNIEYTRMLRTLGAATPTELVMAGTLRIPAKNCHWNENLTKVSCQEEMGKLYFTTNILDKNGFIIEKSHEIKLDRIAVETNVADNKMGTWRWTMEKGDKVFYSEPIKTWGCMHGD